MRRPAIKVWLPCLLPPIPPNKGSKKITEETFQEQSVPPGRGRLLLGRRGVLVLHLHLVPLAAPLPPEVGKWVGGHPSHDATAETATSIPWSPACSPSCSGTLSVRPLLLIGLGAIAAAQEPQSAPLGAAEGRLYQGLGT